MSPPPRLTIPAFFDNFAPASSALGRRACPQKRMDYKGFIGDVRRFIDSGEWRDGGGYGRRVRSALRVLRIVVKTISEFMEQKAMVRASALTYYTLLSLVPILALAFAIAKGFGLESLLTGYIRANVASADLADYVLTFAGSALDNAKGGLIAGVGVVMLLYSVFKLLNSIEAAFNAMWCVKSSRSMVRKLTDYVCIMLFGPILLLVAMSANIVLRSSLKSYLSGGLSPLQDVLVEFVPLLFLWAVFSLLYLVMPNAKVKLSSAVISGVVTGTIFQAVQWVYITFQVGVSNAGAIYGSFAFLPLLLAWLQLTWTIVLAGCKIAFSIQDASKYDTAAGPVAPSARLQRTLSLLVMRRVVEAFGRGERRSGIELADDLGLDRALFFQIVEGLCDAGLLAEVKTDDKSERTFIPGCDVARLTPRLICSKVDALGDDARIHVERTEEFERMEREADLWSQQPGS